MSGDWQVGDLAVCVDNAPNAVERRAYVLEVGRAYKVGVVGIPDGVTYVCLGFRDHKDMGRRKGWTLAFAATRFRKIRPDKHEACEEEFKTLLKRKRVSA